MLIADEVAKGEVTADAAKAEAAMLIAGEGAGGAPRRAAPDGDR